MRVKGAISLTKWAMTPGVSKTFYVEAAIAGLLLFPLPRVRCVRQYREKPARYLTYVLYEPQVQGSTILVGSQY